MTEIAPVSPLVDRFSVETNESAADVSATVDFATTTPTPTSLTFRLATDAPGTAPATETAPITPQERAAAESLRQALSGVDFTRAGFVPAAAGAVPTNTSRFTVGTVGSWDVRIDPATGLPDATALTQAQQGVLTTVQQSFSAYLRAAKLG